MIARLETVNENSLNIIIYSSSPTLDLMAREILRKKFTKDKECVIDTFTAKELAVAKSNSMVSPLSGGKWLIHVNTEKLNFKELVKAVNTNSSYGVTVYWTNKYKVYKDLTNLEVLKKMGTYCSSYYFGRLDGYSMQWLYNTMLGEGSEAIPKEMLVFLAKDYAYKIEDVCTLFKRVKAGYEVKTKKDIIELIGLGNNSHESLALYLLTSTTTTDKGKAMLQKKVFKLLADLIGPVDSEKDEDARCKKIRNYMLAFVNNCIQLKQLQIMGYYMAHDKKLPSYVDEKKLAFLRRFERRILEDVSMPRLLNLKLCLLKYNSYSGKISLTQALLEYIGTLGNY